MKNFDVANSKKKYWFYCHITLPLGLPCQPKINDVRQMSFLYFSVVVLFSKNIILFMFFYLKNFGLVLINVASYRSNNNYLQ